MCQYGSEKSYHFIISPLQGVKLKGHEMSIWQEKGRVHMSDFPEQKSLGTLSHIEIKKTGSQFDA